MILSALGLFALLAPCGCVSQTRQQQHAPSLAAAPAALRGAVAAWNFDDGGASTRVRSALPGGADGTHKWGVWLPDSRFGKVLDFSTEGSYFKASEITLGKRFSLSVWIKVLVSIACID